MAKIKCIKRSYYVPHGFKYVEILTIDDKILTYGIKAFEAKFGKVGDYPMCYQIEDKQVNDDNDLDFLD